MNQQLFNDLQFIGEGPASFYKDIYTLIDQHSKLSMISHSIAHNLREIQSAVIQVLYGCSPSFGNKNAESFSEKTEIISSWLDIESNQVSEWKPFGDLHELAHRNKLYIEVDSKEKIFVTLAQFESLYTNILIKFKLKFFEICRTIDLISSVEYPTKSEIKIFESLPRFFRIREYFYQQCNSVHWLTVLHNQEVFKYPEKMIVVENNRIWYPNWPELGFLNKCSETDLNKHFYGYLLKCLNQIPETENPRIQEGIIDILMKIECSDAKEFIEKVITFNPQEPYSQLFEKKADFAVRLFRNGYIKECLRLFENIIQLRKTNDGYLVNELMDDILDNKFDEVAVAHPVETINLLIKFYNVNYSRLERYHKKKSPNDYSSIWRKNIIYSTHHDLENMILNFIIRNGTRSVEKKYISLDQLIHLLKTGRWEVFRRLELYFISIFPSNNLKLTRYYIFNFKFVFNFHLENEYELLVQNSFDLLSKRKQKKLILWLQKIPKHHNYYIQSNPDFKMRIERLHFSRMFWVKEKLSGKCLDYYNQLYSKYFTEKSPYDIGDKIWVGPTSPYSVDEVNSWSSDFLISTLQKWTPEDHYYAPSYSGFVRTLNESVKLKPVYYSKISYKFVGLKFFYVEGLISGLWESIRKDNTVERDEYDWNCIILLCEQTLSNPNLEYADLNERQFINGWYWCKNQMAHLLDLGFRQGKNSIPIELMERAFAIAAILINDEHPTPDDEKNINKNGHQSAFDLSVNSVRPEALNGIISYSLKQKSLQDENKSFVIEVRVKNILDIHLSNEEHSAAVHSVYGVRFPDLF